MTLDQLRIFATVADTLNMTRAAQSLHLSQPAISAANSAARIIIRMKMVFIAGYAFFRLLARQSASKASRPFLSMILLSPWRTNCIVTKLRPVKTAA